jgi:hypothetical protein
MLKESRTFLISLDESVALENKISRSTFPSLNLMSAATRSTGPIRTLNYMERVVQSAFPLKIHGRWSQNSSRMISMCSIAMRALRRRLRSFSAAVLESGAGAVVLEDVAE